MLTSLSSNAISAKARAIYGKRLTNNNYTELLRLQTVSDVCGYLKTNTCYGKYLSGVDEVSIHRGQLENLLKRSRIEKYFPLCSFEFSKNNGFYRYVISNAEVSVILNALMHINSGSNAGFIANLPTFLQEYTTIDFSAISKVKNFSDLLAVLEHTPYKDVIKKFNAENGNINFRDCEHSLKTFYYKTMLDDIDKFYTGKTKDELTEIVLLEIDLLNLSIMYRLRRYFNYPPEEVKLRLVPFQYKLTSRVIDNFLESKEKNEYIEKMKQLNYNRSMKTNDFNYIEDYTKRLRYVTNRRMMRFSTHAPVAFFALMSLTQIEIENIIIIIEGIRYNTSSQVKNLLILK